jgi:hypothetical protein
LGESCTCWITIIMKRKLNSDGQQFPQYQQNEQLIIPSKHWTRKATRHMLEIQVQVWDRQ